MLSNGNTSPRPKKHDLRIKEEMDLSMSYVFHIAD